MELALFYDDIPCPLGARGEPVFKKMVRHLLNEPGCGQNLAQFCRTFAGARKVWMKPFFNCSEHQDNCWISLRFTHGTLDELVKEHIEHREDLLCRNGHALEAGGSEAGGSKIKEVTCWCCNENKLRSSYYCCQAKCAFYVCTHCMVFSKERSADLKGGTSSGRVDMDEPPATILRPAALAGASSSNSAPNPDVTGNWQRPVPEKPVLIVLIRGHVLRVGDRLSDNFEGDVTALHTVFNSIQTKTDKLEKYKLVFLLDIVASNADSQTHAQVLDIVGRYVKLYGQRVSNLPLGPCQTDSLLQTLTWADQNTKTVANIVGTLVLRADCYLKEKVDLNAWVDRGIEAEMCVFPFMVWHNAPADQLFFIPESCHEHFKRSVRNLTFYSSESLNRQSLHYMYCKKCLRGRLKFVAEVICDANSRREWNPFYRIMGRSEQAQGDEHRAKWGEFWFSEPR
jgi:hypothetical protein